jgi:SAM-dependent methyltransferase/uncharacterized protein YbaR (Trm112 family)
LREEFNLKIDLLDFLLCPECASTLTVISTGTTDVEIREGSLRCSANPQHRFAIENGIVKFCTAFDNHAVENEVAYVNASYGGDDRLTDSAFIAALPEAGAAIWPHTAHFGADFRGLLEKLNIPPLAVVLDVGTCSCWTSRIMAQRGFTVIAMDVVETPYNGLQSADIQFGTHNVYFERVLESMTALPFRDSSIDFITFNAAFHHSPDELATLKECSRVLKNGGKVGMANEAFTALRHTLGFSHLREEDSSSSHHAIPYSRFAKLASESGFRCELYLPPSTQRRLSDSFARPLVPYFARWNPLLRQLTAPLVVLTKK